MLTKNIAYAFVWLPWVLPWDYTSRCYMCMMIHEWDKFMRSRWKESKGRINLLAMQYGLWLMTLNDHSTKEEDTNPNRMKIHWKTMATCDKDYY